MKEEKELIRKDENEKAIKLIFSNGDTIEIDKRNYFVFAFNNNENNSRNLSYSFNQIKLIKSIIDNYEDKLIEEAIKEAYING